MELADRRVSELMVPRVDVVAFDLSRDKSELIGLIKDSRLLRIPVYEGDIDKVKGVILSKDFLLNPDRSPARLIRPVRFIPEQASVEALLELFRWTGSKLALVVDEYGGIAGIVALEDIVEAIVGEIHAPDEPDALPELQQVDDTTFIVDAGLDVDDFCRAFNLPIEESRIHTVAGLMSEKLDRFPKQGDQLTLGHARLTVVSLKDHRILRIRLALERPAEDTPELRRLLGLSVTGTSRADQSHRSGA
jgi:putative hemolysin